MANPTSNAKLFGFLIVLVGIVGGYLYYSQTIKPSEATTPPAPVAANDDLRAFQDLKLDFSILNDTVYKSLSVFGEAPVNPGITGKKDLFAP